MYKMDIFFFKQKTAYEMRMSDWSSDVCSSDLPDGRRTTSIYARGGRAGRSGGPCRPSRLARADPGPGGGGRPGGGGGTGAVRAGGRRAGGGDWSRGV